MAATAEQEAICASTGQVIKIRAGAGTGKTTTLRGLAFRNPSQRMLYLAFNRAIKDEAQSKFGPNVKAMTAHGLAFSRIGRDYANVKDKLAAGDLKPFHVLPLLQQQSSLKIPAPLHNLYGGRVIESVKRFLISPDPELDASHLALSGSPGEKKHFKAEKMLADSQLLWQAMQDLASPVPMIHDGYLKLFQLSLPQLGYDVILLDEAQDTNPVTDALVRTQSSRQVYVGDEHQAIYGFRGAQNAMDQVVADEEFLLTGCFRFGPQVAEIANLILEAKGEKDLRLRGLGGQSQVAALPKGAPHAFIARSNSGLFARAVQALEEGTAFAFVGALSNYRFDLIEQTFGMRQGRKARDPFLASFKDFEELEAYAEAMEDRELLGRCKLVKRYGGRIPYLVAQIQSKAGAYPGSSVPLVLTSAHRSKGLEFERVVVADDFMDFFDEDSGSWKRLNPADPYEREEVNLQYVAVTRARRQLELGEKLQAFVHYRKALERKKAARAEKSGG